MFDLRRARLERGADRRVRAAARRSSPRRGRRASGSAGSPRSAARELGLAPGTPVALGGGDTRCGLLGAGAVADGDVGLVAGTTAPLERVLDEPLVDPEGRLRSGHHAVPGRYVLEANVGPIGEGFAWLARLLHPDEARPEERFTAEAATAAVGSAAMLANVGALVANDRATRLSRRLALALAHDRHAGPSRAREPRALGARGHGVRGAREPRAARARHGPRDAAHPSRRRALAQRAVRADPRGRHRRGGRARGRAEATGLGAALCAGVGAGVFADAREAARRGVRAGESAEPIAAGAAPTRSSTRAGASCAPRASRPPRRSRCATCSPPRSRPAQRTAPPRARRHIGRTRSSRRRSTTRRSPAARVRRRRVRELPRPHAAAHGREPREGARGPRRASSPRSTSSTRRRSRSCRTCASSPRAAATR